MQARLTMLEPMHWQLTDNKRGHSLLLTALHFIYRQDLVEYSPWQAENTIINCWFSSSPPLNTDWIHLTSPASHRIFQKAKLRKLRTRKGHVEVKRHTHNSIPGSPWLHHQVSPLQSPLHCNTSPEKEWLTLSHLIVAKVTNPPPPPAPVQRKKSKFVKVRFTDLNIKYYAKFCPWGFIWMETS